MEDLPTEDEALELLVLLGWTRDTIRRIRQKELSQYGISPDQAALLQLVHNLGGTATPSQMSPLLLRERHSVHELIVRMERAGLLTKVEDPNRKHGVKVILTERGKQAYRQSKKREAIVRILAALSKEDRGRLKSYLSTLLNAARKEVGEVEARDITEIFGSRRPRARKTRASDKVPA